MSADRRAQDHRSDLHPRGLGKQPPTRGSRTDRVGLIDAQARSDIEPGCRQPEREHKQGERVGHHLADVWLILLLLTPTPILPHPQADLECQEDDRHSGQEDGTDRDEIERSIVSHTVPDRSARGKSCGHRLNDMVLPIAEIER